MSSNVQKKLDRVCDAHFCWRHGYKLRKMSDIEDKTEQSQEQAAPTSTNASSAEQKEVALASEVSRGSEQGEAMSEGNGNVDVTMKNQEEAREPPVPTATRTASNKSPDNREMNLQQQVELEQEFSLEDLKDAVPYDVRTLRKPLSIYEIQTQPHEMVILLTIQ